MAGWRETVGAIVDAPGAVVFVGPVDVGKTTRAMELANAAVRAGRRTAVVDADTGQSDIGPPATVALGTVRRPIRRMAEIPVEAAFFVGDTAPGDLYPFLVEGTARLVGRARDRGAEVVVVDTTGWVLGPAAVAAKVWKIRRVRPRHVIAIQRVDEVEPILARLSPRIAVHRLRPSPRVRVRSSAERRATRERRFGQYFARARRLSLDLHALAARRPVVLEGRRLPPARALAEASPRTLHHLLVGLADEEGFLVAMGTVVAVHRSADRVDVLAPADSPARLREIQWGMLRVAPSGTEEGRLTPRP